MHQERGIKRFATQEQRKGNGINKVGNVHGAHTQHCVEHCSGRGKAQNSPINYMFIFTITIHA